MLATGAQLAQLRPMVTDQIVTAFTANILTEISLIIVCNNANQAQGYSLYHDDDGTTFDLDTVLDLETSVPANSSVHVEAASQGSGIMVNKGGSIAIASTSGGALTFSIYGTTAREIGYSGIA